MLEPPDRLTCPELTEALRCDAHCDAVCARAVECATFDRALCVLGCSKAEPVVCNAASADARSCDQIKVEARGYEQIGKVLRQGGEVDSFNLPYPSGMTAASGLCRNGSYCTAPLGCSLTTNVCSPCESDVECKSDVDPRRACMPSGECVTVACTQDRDCSFNPTLGGVCDVATHSCVGCIKDSDCRSGACDIAQRQCAECSNDSHCSGSLVFPACDADRQRCVMCTRDEHCASGVLGVALPACDVSRAQCVGCTDDSQCKDPRSPYCDPRLHLCTVRTDL